MNIPRLPMNCDDLNSRRRKWKLVFPRTDEGSAHEEFAIDKNDYHTVRDIVLASGEHRYSTIELKRNDTDRRVYKLRYTLRFPQVSNYEMVSTSIGKLKNLSNLTHLDLGHSDILWLPPTIGQLQNLQELDLSYTIDLSSLPREIGNLTSLMKLNLNYSGIIARSFPSSIGRLQNLKELDLSYTENLLYVPEIIGELTGLQTLNLDRSAIKSLPSSIGRLHNLKELNLQWTGNLSHLPHEIGELTSLTILNLRHSDIRFLPPSIGLLQNLEALHVDYTKYLKEFPEELGNLSNLKFLGVNHSGILLKALPKFLGRLKGLMQLGVFGNAMALRKSEYRDLLCLQKESFLTLIQQCHILGSLCIGTYPNCIELTSSKGLEEIRYTLACNRARSRTGFGRIRKYRTSSNEVIVAKLWPRLVCSAMQAFSHYSFDEIPYSGEQEPICVTKTDALYQLLVDGRESFISVLINRQQITW